MIMTYSTGLSSTYLDLKNIAPPPPPSSFLLFTIALETDNRRLETPIKVGCTCSGARWPISSSIELAFRANLSQRHDGEGRRRRGGVGCQVMTYFSLFHFCNLIFNWFFAVFPCIAFQYYNFPPIFSSIFCARHQEIYSGYQTCHTVQFGCSRCAGYVIYVGALFVQ